MLNELIGALLQLVVFTAIPFLVYVISKRKTSGFGDYLGLKKSNKKANIMALGIVVILVGPMLVLMFINDDFKQILIDPSTITGKIRAMENSSLAFATILIVAILKTSLTEEILFRGFLAKRLIAMTNFTLGNMLQAIIFGVIHAWMFSHITDNKLFLGVIFLFPTLGAYAKVYVNEKMAGGSIIPGWIAHGTTNLIAYSTIAFLV